MANRGNVTGNRLLALLGGAVFVGMAGLGAAPVLLAASPVQVSPATMPRVGTVDERFQSYNIEMVEVTGGRFWAPYKSGGAAAPAEQPKPGAPVGMDPSMYRYRPPVDLSNARLRKLAAALGPAYVRVSGTWANSTYFDDTGGPAPKTPPEGFGDILTGQQWKGVVDFSKAVDAEIVTSFAISPGVRDASGVWTPVEAKKLVAATKADGGSIAAAEMFNEPNFASLGGAPKGYDAEAYGRDFKAFLAYVREAAPEMKVAGPSAVGDIGMMDHMPASMHGLHAEDLLRAEEPGLDVFSYHFYGGVSQRCAMMAGIPHSTPETALSSEWLSLTVRDEKYYVALRDKYAPGKPMWLTETGETACGGNPWASDFIDSFRYLNQMGVLAKRGVQVIMHNTLDASDYALIDETTLAPRPNYWAALLWRRTMGTTVLDAGDSGAENLHLYAQCLRNVPGGVALLAINADRTASATLDVPAKSERYTLSGELMSDKVSLNGKELNVTASGDLPEIRGKAQKAGRVELAPATITFLAIKGANNAACR
ncbi:hypothetical protein GCM10011507_22930 [Edaphobacter acidisoli]|uniref:Uncharacterized protein n=1 Tax=Edaphobacter acidisoli TaxID=2040573 RepID=A0A916RUA2_9BACT|nr:hypothetical protein [Edaphobacter acidisoli]GGA70786.1 hypothetical protein GCM10011507_22930 [Edaphobacter acidisoli]